MTLSTRPIGFLWCLGGLICFRAGLRHVIIYALYLISAPDREMNVDLIKELGVHLKAMAPEAIIRSGDYPRYTGSIDVSIILSELSDTAKVRSYFSKAIKLISTIKRRQEGLETDRLGIDVTLKDIPSLL